MRKMFRSDMLPAAGTRPTWPGRPEARPLLHAELEDWALRAAMRNGFGGASMAVPGSVDVHARARAAAHAGFGSIATRVTRRARALFRLLRRRRRQAAAWRELQALDPVALRDLGLDVSEIGSLHAEIHGRACLTRRFAAEQMHARPPGAASAFAIH